MGLMNKWHDWYAWYPVILENDTWAWLRNVQRRMTVEYDAAGVKRFIWLYR